jgi:hypothetical protein
MFEGYTISYVYGLDGEKINIKIASPEVNGHQDILLVPLTNTNNRHYKMVMEWVEEGNTIIDNPPEEDR